MLSNTTMTQSPIFYMACSSPKATHKDINEPPLCHIQHPEVTWSPSQGPLSQAKSNPPRSGAFPSHREVRVPFLVPSTRHCPVAAPSTAHGGEYETCARLFSPWLLPEKSSPFCFDAESNWRRVCLMTKEPSFNWLPAIRPQQRATPALRPKPRPIQVCTRRQQ